MATKKINDTYGTDIRIDRLRVSLISWDTALENIYIQDYQGDTLAHIKELNTSILNLKELAGGQLEFGDIDIDGLYLNLKTYKDAPDTNLGIFIDQLDDGKPRAPGTPPFYFNTTGISVINSRFLLTDENLETAKILDFKDLEISADDFTILGPEVTADITALKFLSPRGLEMQNMATNFSYSREEMRFDSLRLQSPGSVINGNLTFSYKREDLVDFTNKVLVDAQFNESSISLDEVNVLAPIFGTGKVASLSAGFSGTLNDLTVSDLLLVCDQTGMRGTYEFKNLFDREEPFVINGQIRNITTSYYQLRGLMPEILGPVVPPSVQRLGQFTLRGQAEVTGSSVNAQLNINSPLGSAYADLKMNDVDQAEKATYAGFVSLIDFDLARFTRDKNLGRTSLDLNVEGTGFTQESLNTEIIGEVYTLAYNGYDYKDISVSGIVKDQLFDGSLNSKDPNLMFTFDGLADFGSNPSTFNFNASVDHANLFALNFIDDSVSVFQGNVAMDIVGDDPDNFRGDIRFSQTQFRNANNTYFFEDFQIVSSFDQDTVRTIEINSPDIITGYMSGKFKTRELGRLLQNSAGSIYTNYRPYEISPGQQLNFNFSIYNKIVEVFLPEVSFGPNTFIRGKIDADAGDFKLNFRSPSIVAFGNSMDSIDVRIDNKNPLFNTYVAVQDVSTVYYDVRDFELINTTVKDTLFFRTEFKGGSTYNDSYNLNFYHTFNKENKSVIGLKRSDVSFKGNTWVLNREGNDRNKVIINRTLDSLMIEEVVMNNEAREEILLRGELADSTYKDLELRFKIVSLNKITPAIDSLKLSGEVNGVLNVRQEDDIYLPIGNLNISDFGVNNVPLGELDIGIIGNKNLTEFSVNTRITNQNREVFSVIGTVLDQGEYPTANLTASFLDFPLHPFNALGEGVIDQIRGDLNGTARIVGDIRNPEMSGLLTLNGAGLAIPYLNVNYDFAPVSRVRLDNQTFDFQNIRLTDTEMSTRAVLDGTIRHQFFDDWNLDLNVDTQGERFLLLNTEFDEDELYYGQAYAVGKGDIIGPTNALVIDFVGATGPGTSLKIPLSDIATVGDYSFINFIEKDQRRLEEEGRVLREYEGLELNFDLDVTPDAEVEIVVDQQTGSSLKGRGAGLIFMEINTNGTFNMFGDFVATEGSYRLKYGGIIDRTFRVKPDGRITWDGDPLDALLDMEAVYSLNANPAPLLDNGFTRSIPTEVIIRLTGELEQPTVEFDVAFPGASSIVTSELQYQLQDPTVKERNALFLLAQGTFVNQTSGLNQNAIAGSLIGSATTNWFNKALGANADRLNVALSYEASYSDPNAEVLQEDRVGLSVSTRITDRILFNGRFGVPVGGVSQSAVAGDAEVQLLLNDPGTLSMRIFNRQNDMQQIIGDRQGYTQGVGLSYEVDFNTTGELFRKIFGTQPKEDQRVVPSDSLQVLQPNDSLVPRDSLIRFVPKNKKPF